MVMTSAELATLTNGTLVHSCVISSRQQARDEDDNPAFDAYGAPILTEYAPRPGRVACFARQRPGSGDIQEPGRELVAAGWQVRLPRGTALTTDDRIGDVRDGDGSATVIVAGPLAVDEVIVRAGHLLAVSLTTTLSGPETVEDA
jgi:hypothetical protein